MSDQVTCFEDKDGDILSVKDELDLEGRRYIAVICAGDEMGVLLEPDQQTVLGHLLLGDNPALVLPEHEYRILCAEKAGEILRSHGNLFGGSGSVDAQQVIALAAWIAYADEDCCD